MSVDFPPRDRWNTPPMPTRPSADKASTLTPFAERPPVPMKPAERVKNCERIAANAVLECERVLKGILKSGEPDEASRASAQAALDHLTSMARQHGISDRDAQTELAKIANIYKAAKVGVRERMPNYAETTRPQTREITNVYASCHAIAQLIVEKLKHADLTFNLDEVDDQKATDPDLDLKLQPLVGSKAVDPTEPVELSGGDVANFLDEDLPLPELAKAQPAPVSKPAKKKAV